LKAYLAIIEIEIPVPRGARKNKRIVIETSDIDVPKDAGEDDVSDSDYDPKGPIPPKLPPGRRPLPNFIHPLSSDEETDDGLAVIKTLFQSKDKGKAKQVNPGKSRDERRSALSRSYDLGNEVPVVMLISLKAGALGLQLTAANNVYLVCDPEFCANSKSLRGRSQCKPILSIPA
jgi:SWI/SNF-related matrix-associated actin-dependent regulator of chromatin subfamily A3